MDFKGIKHIVFSSDAEDTIIVNAAKKSNLKSYLFLDARSAIYGATGIAAQNMETVIVVISGDNASRSAYSGMTEAFYRDLPVILITVGGELDYSKELGDVIKAHHKAEKEADLEVLLKNISMPAHIEFLGSGIVAEKKSCSEIQKALAEALMAEDYLYFSSNIDVSDITFNCKVVYGGMPNCYAGALANVLGASLAKKHNRYAGVVTEEEFLHDMNTLGNININDSLLYVVVCDHNNSLIGNYAKSLGFEVDALSNKDIKQDCVNDIVKNNKKIVLVIYGDNE